MSLKKHSLFAVVATLSLVLLAPAYANGIGEGRSYQFRSDNQRQVLLGVERTRLELLGLLSSDSGGLGSGSGQTGNAVSIVVTGNNNNITVDQTNSGNQQQTTDCSNSRFNITGGMYGC